MLECGSLFGLSLEELPPFLLELLRSIDTLFMPSSRRRPERHPQ